MPSPLPNDGLLLWTLVAPDRGLTVVCTLCPSDDGVTLEVRGLEAPLSWRYGTPEAALARAEKFKRALILRGWVSVPKGVRGSAP